MNVDGLLWLEAVKSRLLGKRNPFWLVLRSLWYAVTDIPLMFAARKQLIEAVEQEARKQRRYKHTGSSRWTRDI